MNSAPAEHLAATATKDSKNTLSLIGLHHSIVELPALGEVPPEPDPNIISIWELGHHHCLRDPEEDQTFYKTTVFDTAAIT